MMQRSIQQMCCMTAVAMSLATAPALAVETELLYDDFGQPDVSDPGFFPMVLGWVEEGPESTQQGFTGKLDTGIFHNVPPIFDGHYSNITANQAMFMGGRDADQPGITEPISVNRTLGDTFEAGKTYTLAFAAGQSYNQPPNAGAELELRLFYLVGGNRVTVGNVVISTSDVADVNVAPSGAPPFFNSFTPFGFDVAVLGTDPWAGQPIGVEVRPISGTGGFWDVDVVRLTVIPEPTSLLALGFGTFLLLGRLR